MTNASIGNSLGGVIANTNSIVQLNWNDEPHLSYYKIAGTSLVYGRPVPSANEPLRGDGFPNDFLDEAPDAANVRLLGSIGKDDRWVAFHQGNPLLLKDGTRLKIADVGDDAIGVTDQDKNVTEIPLSPIEGEHVREVREHLIHGARSAFLPLGTKDMEAISFGNKKKFLLIFSENVTNGKLGEFFGARTSAEFWRGIEVRKSRYFYADLDGKDVGKAAVYNFMENGKTVISRQLNHGRKGPLQYLNSCDMCTVPSACGDLPFERMDAVQILEMGIADFTELLPTVVGLPTPPQLSLGLNLNLGL